METENSEIMQLIRKIVEAKLELADKIINSSAKAGVANIDLILTTALQTEYGTKITTEKFLSELSKRTGQTPEETQQEIRGQIKGMCNQSSSKKKDRILTDLDIVKRCGRDLCNIANQTEEVIRAAIERTPHALQAVRNPTKEHCIMAIDKSPCALKHVRKLPQEEYEEVCKYLLKKDGEYIRYVPKKNDMLCMFAIEHSEGTALKYIEFPTIEMIERAIDYNPANLQYVKEQNPEKCLAAVERNPLAALYINKDLLGKINDEMSSSEDDAPIHLIDALKKLAQKEKPMAPRM